MARLVRSSLNLSRFAFGPTGAAGVGAAFDPADEAGSPPPAGAAEPSSSADGDLPRSPERWLPTRNSRAIPPPDSNLTFFSNRPGRPEPADGWHPGAGLRKSRRSNSQPRCGSTRQGDDGASSIGQIRFRRLAYG